MSLIFNLLLPPCKKSENLLAIPAASEFLIIGDGLECLGVLGEVDDLLAGDEIDVRKPQNLVDEGQETIHPGLVV